MYFALQSTALSSLLLVLALLPLLSPVHAVPLTAREGPQYEAYVIDKSGSRVTDSGITIPQTNAGDIIKKVFQTALPDAEFKSGPLPITAETQADKNQMMYAEITGQKCNPCYLWSARNAWDTRYGALLYRDKSGGVVPLGKAEGPGPDPTQSQLWKDFNNQALKELGPLKSWVGRDPKVAMGFGNILNRDEEPEEEEEKK